MSYEISVIAPCYNEAGNLRELVERLERVFELKNLIGQIVLVDDGSKDSTPIILEELAEVKQHIKIFIKPENEGMVSGWKKGLEIADGEYVCLIDADLQNLPEDVWRLYRELQYSKVDIVQGFRSSIGRVKESRYILSKSLNFILNRLFGMSLKDNKSGFICCRKEVLEEILRYKYNYKFFQTFIMVAAASKGFTIYEIETIFESREVGKSFIPKIPFYVIFQVLFESVLAFYEFKISKTRKTILGDYVDSKGITPKIDTMPGWRRLLFNFYCRTMPLHAWMITRNIKNCYDELQKSQWLSPAEIKELQEIKLRRLIHQAYYHVIYYREIFDSLGLKPRDIQTIEDLQKLPLLDKKTIKERLYFDLLSNNHKKKSLYKITTSGSTGEPFVCFVDRFQLEMRWAATLRSQEWTGYRFGDRQARLWHQTIGMSWKQILRERFDAFLSRRIFIPAYEMGDDNIVKSIKKMRSFKPVFVDGYAESFNLLAHYIKKNGIKGFKPKGIMSSAQVLPEQSRNIIQDEFQCKVYDKYGSREFSGIAYESDVQDGHLVVAENYIVEILKDGQPAKPGEVGEVVITDLNNYCMPFIRYRVGDLATAMDNSIPSPCGRGLPRIGQIQGRVQAIIFGANGKYIPGTFFAHLFKDYEHAVKQYQVIQEKVGEIELKIIKANRFTETVFQEILGILKKYLGEPTTIQVSFVDNIPMVRTGKHQGAISKVSFDFQKGVEIQSSDP